MIEKTIDVAKESTSQRIYDKVATLNSKIQAVPETLSTFNVSEYNISSTDNYGTPPGETLLNLNGKIYCISTSDTVSFLYEMNDAMISNKKIAELPYPFNPIYSCALVYNNEIHIIGGANTNCNRFHYRWDGKKWRVASMLPCDCSKVCAVVYHNEIHIIGGVSTNNEYTTKHYKWNGVKWESLSNIPDVYNTKNQKVVFVYNNNLCVFGLSMLADNTLILSIWNGTRWVNITKTSNLTFDDNTCCLPCTIDSKNYIFFFTSDGRFFNYGANGFSNVDNLSNEYVGSNVSTIGRYCATISTNKLPVVAIVNKDKTNQYITNLPRLFEFTTESNYRIIGTLYGTGSHIPEYNKLTNYGRVVVHKGEIYLFSNYNNGTIFRFDETSHKWIKEDITRNEVNVSSFVFHGIVSMSDGIHLIGTVSENHMGCSHFVFSNGQIKLLSNPPFRFLNGSLVSHNGELHAIGGYGLKDMTYNHYKWNKEDDTWTALGITPYNVYGYQAATSYRDCIYAIGYSANFAKEYIMVWVNGRWITSISKTNLNCTTGSTYSSPDIRTEVECADCIFVHNNRLCVSNMNFGLNDDVSNNLYLTYSILLQNQDSKSYMDVNKLVTCKCCDYTKPVVLRSTIKMLPYNGSVCLIDTFDGQIRLSNRTYEPISDNTIRIFIPEGHKIHCSKSVYYPLTLYTKEIDDGFESTKTTYHVFSRTGFGDELNYTIQ